MKILAVCVRQREPGNEMSPLMGLLTDLFVHNRYPGAIGGWEAQQAQEMREKSELLGAGVRAGGTVSIAPWSGHPPGSLQVSIMSPVLNTLPAPQPIQNLHWPGEISPRHLVCP